MEVLVTGNCSPLEPSTIKRLGLMTLFEFTALDTDKFLFLVFPFSTMCVGETVGNDKKIGN